MAIRWVEDVPIRDTYNAGEAVKLMHISHRTLMQLLEDGTLRRVRHPRHSRIILIPRVDVEVWVEKAGPPLRREKEDKEGRPTLAVA